MAYTLTLTRADRGAIDWVGHRYAHGDDLRDTLYACDVTTGEEWDGPEDWVFNVPEHVAWTISDIIDSDNLACFASSLREKLYAFQDRII